MGATKRTLISSASILALAAILSFPSPGRSGEREVAGMITEIHLGEGRVEVRSAETELWRPAMPLLTLRAGDTVTTTQDAWVVIVLTGGRGSVRVDEANAPFSVTAPLVDRGPLHKGSVDERSVTCPWHLSAFRLADGAVLRGPATAPQPALRRRFRPRRTPSPSCQAVAAGSGWPARSGRGRRRGCVS